MTKGNHMRHFFPVLAVIVMPFLCVWLLSGFVVWDWHPGQWSQVIRLNVALTGSGFAIFCSWIYWGNT